MLIGYGSDVKGHQLYDPDKRTVFQLRCQV